MKSFRLFRGCKKLHFYVQVVHHPASQTRTTDKNMCHHIRQLKCTWKCNHFSLYGYVVRQWSKQCFCKKEQWPLGELFAVCHRKRNSNRGLFPCIHFYSWRDVSLCVFQAEYTSITSWWFLTASECVISNKPHMQKSAATQYQARPIVAFVIGGCDSFTNL